MQPARDIIRRIRKRQLYKITNDVLIPAEKKHIYEQISEELLVENKHPASTLTVNDIIIHKLTLNYGMFVSYTQYCSADII